ncbi:MAG: SIMPL domain-containing protein [Treponema sp.]|nr:SIMPL domain-containing protein [Treponema sp.]
MKRFVKSILIAAVLALALSSCGQSDVHNMRTITVSGKGNVYVTPDRSTVNLSVITRNADIKSAQTENAETMKRVLSAISSAGISSEDIQTYDYGISQDYHWKDDEKVYGEYKVSNRIKVTVSDVEKAGGIIDVAIQNGATGVDSLSFNYEDEPAAVKRARALAIENAKAIARESVETAGAKLGKVLIMEEQSGNLPSYMSRITSNSLSQTWGGAAVYSDMADSSTPFSTGKKEISVIVNIMYELR